MRKLFPKFVKRAQMWCVTLFEYTDKKEKQTVEWFSTLEEALSFYNKQ